MIDVPAHQSPWQALSEAEAYVGAALAGIQADLAAAERSLDEVAHRDRERAFGYSERPPVEGSAENQRLHEQMDAMFGGGSRNRGAVDLSARRNVSNPELHRALDEMFGTNTMRA